MEQEGAGCAGLIIAALGIFVVGPLFGAFMAGLPDGGPAAGYRWMFVIWAASLAAGALLMSDGIAA